MTDELINDPADDARQQAVREMSDALSGPHVRVDFFESIAFNTGDAGAKPTRMVDAAKVWVPGETRGGNFKWVRHGEGVLVSDSRLESLATVMRYIGCPKCAHLNHGDTDCGVEVGYDHINGSHECGCSGEQDLPSVADIAEFLDVMNPVATCDEPNTNPNRYQIEQVLNAIKGLSDATS